MNNYLLIYDKNSPLLFEVLSGLVQKLNGNWLLLSTCNDTSIEINSLQLESLILNLELVKKISSSPLLGPYHAQSYVLHFFEKILKKKWSLVWNLSQVKELKNIEQYLTIENMTSDQDKLLNQKINLYFLGNQYLDKNRLESIFLKDINTIEEKDIETAMARHILNIYWNRCSVSLSRKNLTHFSTESYETFIFDALAELKIIARKIMKTGSEILERDEVMSLLASVKNECIKCAIIESLNEHDGKIKYKLKQNLKIFADEIEYLAKTSFVDYLKGDLSLVL